ncbi:hypothetical protein LX32DRAFT_641275 [Colletotrichum zoysiae]|uniref:Uncharacterized protein n=1 Tax=Colletotrichum zoysiae TaxID=1216348 RepID=A0AAD9HDK2_9PEZI|nr:hypothetical protein LX32DRAFT_641275 [Colletotrichum zoysiae]
MPYQCLTLFSSPSYVQAIETTDSIACVACHHLRPLPILSALDTPDSVIQHPAPCSPVYGGNNCAYTTSAPKSPQRSVHS